MLRTYWVFERFLDIKNQAKKHFLAGKKEKNIFYRKHDENGQS